jgi:Ca-activated chloride channel homolog
VKFAQPMWLFGAAFALVVAALLIAGGLLLLRSVRRFGDEREVNQLVTGRASARRALKGVLLVLAVALAFVAAAQPQYGRGTRLIPATNLDVVIVLDYSKSMYAEDVTPSRTARAKAEVSQLIHELPGARFGAVAFAGEPMSFPLTSDGAAIAQFFRQLTPDDMPVGGTAIARALEAGRALFDRDPLSHKHRKVIVLVTDGEDLEGDPVSVAQSAAADGITIDVAQIGGRTPEPIPNVDESGQVTGWRHDDNGKPLTTSLSAEGEAQLTKIAELTHGRIVRSQYGETGIREIATRLHHMMTEELSEKVQMVYADVYMYPLGLAILLLLLETFVSQTKKRARPTVIPPPADKRRPKRRRAVKRAAVAAGTGLLVALLAAASGCGHGPDAIFMRDSPTVNEAIRALDGGEAGTATSLLESYLSTGRCEKGQIGVPEQVRKRSNASFDLGLGLFKIGEQFGRRFGDEEPTSDAGPTPAEQHAAAERSEQVDCALRIVELVAGDATQPIALRARAYYLAGNLEFLRREYRAAVDHYDASLKLIPGLPGDAGDDIGRKAAWNRAIALKRIEDQKHDASPPDASPDASPDAGRDSGRDSGHDSGRDSGHDGGGDSGGGHDGGRDGSNQNQSNNGRDGGRDGGARPDAGQSGQDAGRKPPPQNSANEDQRMLDMLERAPTLQQQTAKHQARAHPVSGMEDK